MSREYAEDRIREALRQSGGNLSLAKQQIMAWTYEDTKLLQALARPHLNGIVAYQVERVASGRAEIEKRQPEAAARPATSDESFGMDILRAVAASGAQIFGQEVYTNAVRKGRASKQHIDAIHRIAKPVPAGKKST